jgi:hypothetical protein
MIVLRVKPDVLTAQALAYAAVVRRVAEAADELLLTVQLCAGALPTVTEDLAPALRHGLGVLEHDHRELQRGLEIVASSYRQLDHELFR